jgi:conjugative transfer signal peptidase TraF
VTPLTKRGTTVRAVSGMLARLLGLYVATAAAGCWLGAHLLVNRTPSVPLGLYWLGRTRGALRPGQLVAFLVPPSVRALVGERRYLPDGHLLVKPVAALPGDRVCVAGGIASVNETPIGAVLAADSVGRPLPQYTGCGVLAPGEVFVAAPHAQSFDSRTFGPIDLHAIQGTVTPLWTY